jgi:hypothetical protein
MLQYFDRWRVHELDLGTHLGTTPQKYLPSCIWCSAADYPLQLLAAEVTDETLRRGTPGSLYELGPRGRRSPHPRCVRATHRQANWDSTHG